MNNMNQLRKVWYDADALEQLAKEMKRQIVLIERITNADVSDMQDNYNRGVRNAYEYILDKLADARYEVGHVENTTHIYIHKEGNES